MVNYLYDKGNYEQMKRDLSNARWENELMGKSTEEIWIEIKNTITEMVVAHVPYKTFSVVHRKN